MSTVSLSRAAREDLQGIAELIAEDRPNAAKKVIRKLREAIARLGEMPGLGHVREDLTDQPVKFWPVYSYLIIYREKSTAVHIVRVLHGARDVRSLLDE